MADNSTRTAKSLKNSVVAMIFYVVNLALQFFSRKIFLEYLGTEILGLNTTAMNLLQFLNLAELGIGAAVGFSLYTPFYDKNYETINEIVSLQGKLYRRIAYIVIAVASVLMCLFPWIFAKMALPLWYAYASFGVLLFSALLGYFVNYRQIVLTASQQDYKIQYSYKVAMLAKVFAQILAIRYSSNGYVWWLILEAVFAIIASWVLDLTVRKTYPFIKESRLSLKELHKKYPTIKTKILQIFFHKIGGFALTQISPLIIYAYTSLTMVAIYGNYMLIVFGLISFVTALSSGLTAGVGNLIAEGNNERVFLVFEELFSVRFLISMTMCFGTFTLAQPFITLWLGAGYLLPTSTLSLITAILYISLSRSTVDSYLNAYGFYSDIWSPVIEAILNIGCSILLGLYFGLNGILTGVLISLMLVIFCWKPYFLFGIKLKQRFDRYCVIYLKQLLLGGAVTIISYKALQFLPLCPDKSIGSFIAYAVIDIIGYTAVLSGTLFATDCGIKFFFSRLKA